MIQYETSVDWDVTLIDLEFTDIDNAFVKGLVCFAVKITTGAPTATAGKFMPGAIIANGISGVLYVNTGTTAAPVWSVIDSNTSGLPALTDGKIWAGNVTNVATAVTPSGDVTMTNAGVMAIGAGKVLAAMIGAGAVTTVKIADDAVTGDKIALAGEADGDIMYRSGGVWVRLAKGTAGQTLKMNAGATAPEWV